LRSVGDDWVTKPLEVKRH